MPVVPRYAARAASIGAAAWAFAFAGASFYWAAGGGIGIETIAEDRAALGRAGEDWAVALTGVVKVAAGVLPLALLLPFRSRVHRLLVIVTAALGGGFRLYGVASLVDHALMVSGARDTPQVLGSYAARWHLAFWDPVWIVGGALFLFAAAVSWRRPLSTRPIP